MNSILKFLTDFGIKIPIFKGKNTMFGWSVKVKKT